ncbi:glycosyltransferase family 2 protein [Sulfurovum sp.]|uniref:glycosyltransferase family 2 protein n=1 Tax=Sulfurovum sp. TaxID=1969726 RepID=UPI0035693225
MKDKLTIDIIVPTYNRPEDIKRFIEEIQKQTYAFYKIYIIDDCGTEKIDHLVPTNNPAFSFESLKENKGQAYARNFALAKGSGDIVIFMDDDAWFLEPDALELVAHYFEEDKSTMGCLMFDVLEPNTKWLSELKNLKDEQELGEFIACGCAFKRSTIEKLEGFSGFLHSAAEETDLSLRLIKNNELILFGEKVKIFHNYLPKERSIAWLKQFKHNIVRNDLLIVLMLFPSIYILPYFAGKFVSHVRYNFKNDKRYFITNIQAVKALFSVLILIPTVLKKRNAVSVEQFKYWKKVRF